MEGINIDEYEASNVPMPSAPLVAGGGALSQHEEQGADQEETPEVVQQGRPKRTATVEAMKRIREVLAWEKCSTSSRLFRTVQNQVNNEFDNFLLDRNRVKGNPTGTHYDTESYDSPEEDFIENSTDEDDDESSSDSFVVSDSEEVKYNSSVDEDSSDDDSTATLESPRDSECDDSDEEVNTAAGPVEEPTAVEGAVEETSDDDAWSRGESDANDTADDANISLKTGIGPRCSSPE
jgi:hypothetical protein